MKLYQGFCHVCCWAWGTVASHPSNYSPALTSSQSPLTWSSWESELVAERGTKRSTSALHAVMMPIIPSLTSLAAQAEWLEVGVKRHVCFQRHLQGLSLPWSWNTIGWPVANQSDTKSSSWRQDLRYSVQCSHHALDSFHKPIQCPWYHWWSHGVSFPPQKAYSMTLACWAGLTASFSIGVARS